jgi:hypothetical protein
MKLAEYGEFYRKNTKMKEEDEKDERPLNRPRGWMKNERAMTKKRKKAKLVQKRWLHSDHFVPVNPRVNLLGS